MSSNTDLLKIFIVNRHVVMARSLKTDAGGMVFQLICGAIWLLITVMMTPIFWFVVLAIMIIWISVYSYNYYWDEIFPERYFRCDEFLAQRNKITNYVGECNELNDHIRELKEFQTRIGSKQNGVGVLSDKSDFNFERKTWRERVSGDHVHDCSRTIVSSARNNPFKYLCKYFDIELNENSLEEFESMLNDLSAAEEGAACLAQKKDGLLRSIIYQ